MNTELQTHRFFKWLLLLRALLAGAAIMVILKSSFWTMLFSVAFVFGLVSACETTYVAVVYSTIYAEKRAAELAERRRLAEAAAEAAAARERAQDAARQEASAKYFDLGTGPAGAPI